MPEPLDFQGRCWSFELHLRYMKVLQKIRDRILKKDESFYQALHVQLLPYFIPALIQVLCERPFHLTTQHLLQEYVEVVLDIVEEIN